MLKSTICNLPTMVNKTLSDRKVQIRMMTLTIAVLTGVALLQLFVPAFGEDYATKVKGIVTSMVDILYVVFQAIGVILAAFAVGQLVLAFKNEDADSKSRATTMMVVAVVLLAIKPIISHTKILEQITG